MEGLRWFLRFAQNCNKIGLSGGVSQIECFCNVNKQFNEYS